ncbi:flagellar motor protein MotB [Maribacter sp.]|uniref:OmpA/MotB family protein n=1 Tax=Maribacter sp. TaxID=1897614 RepID=UPI0025C33DFD|nr:OmpA family protein [Maribacter sp.]
MRSLNRQFEYIEELSDEVERKDSINQLLAATLKSSLIDYDDSDIQVEVKGNAVMVSLSDKMMFSTGSARINKAAYEVLGKVALIINEQSDMNVLIEGHTDNVPIKNRVYRDNWDLSVHRATAVVRLLQNNFQVDPQRLTAAGRSEYLPKSNNDSTTGRRNNRRTEITITPRLDDFFKLLEVSAELS